MNDEQGKGPINFELHPDDYTIAVQDEQRLELMDDLEREGMLDPRLRTMLERPEVIEACGIPEMGWLRPVIRRYVEGDLGLADVVAEIAGRAGW
jgi:hypothetical protein